MRPPARGWVLPLEVRALNSKNGCSGFTESVLTAAGTEQVDHGTGPVIDPVGGRTPGWSCAEEEDTCVCE